MRVELGLFRLHLEVVQKDPFLHCELVLDLVEPDVLHRELLQLLLAHSHRPEVEQVVGVGLPRGRELEIDGDVEGLGFDFDGERLLLGVVPFGVLHFDQDLLVELHLLDGFEADLDSGLLCGLELTLSVYDSELGRQVSDPY